MIAEALKYMQSGNLSAAENVLHKIISAEADNVEALQMLAFLKAQSGDHGSASTLLMTAAKLNPADIATLNHLIQSLEAQGDWQAAIGFYEKLISLVPSNLDIVSNLARCAFMAKDFSTSLKAIENAIQLNPNLAHLWSNRGILLKEVSRHDEALKSFDKALVIDPNYLDAAYNKGVTYFELKKYAEAINQYQETIRKLPTHLEATSNLGVCYNKLNQHENAIAYFIKALELNPNYKDAWFNKGVAEQAIKNYGDALHSYAQAIRLDPKYIDANYNNAIVLNILKRHDESIISYKKTIAIDSNNFSAHINIVMPLRALMHHDQALEHIKTALQLSPNEPFLLGNYLHTKMLLCDWEGLDALYSQVIAGMRSGQKTTEPFGLQGICDSEADLAVCAQIFAADHFPAQNPLPAVSRPPSPKIRIGYLCGEFRDQATSILMTGVYESHDQDRFEIYAFDNGWDDGSPLRARITAAFTQMFDITRLTDLQAAQLIQETGIDILVNLNGYFGDGRQGVFAYRPAPVQVNYLGFPGTIGAPYIDYLIADPIVIPSDSQSFYSEKIAYLPHCYQANDFKRIISDSVLTRADFGLPEQGFVYCCFNNNYKITPATFDIWMRILQASPTSVLWLIEDNPTAGNNLQKEAVKRGVDASRILFAKRLPLTEHLARHRLADLFLDTLPYNAHTTASDALWAGLPVLTCKGNSFAGRVAASLLTAINLPEMIASSPAEYEALAIELAHHPEKLQQTRVRLEQHRLTTPLFNTTSFTKDLEAVYEGMMGGASSRNNT
ncbi:tetratricopeptide repeat protein [Polynucleobacter sp. JS-Mosq-20-D10]|uniref:tetratricopeptide repeat protein n=1 Tax=Polynucleobacter sp. JS-Mosq-20-D10 TaxID=2576922 RepID=UPI001BFE40BA|nr:tetratricopeptide repeat protein [Polynucleobacter sp. JS-Mosq-20-D10]QWE00589.1 tetratricopeptide repeat protein [Polynucleobacter sp. JS-Mosq-20-D10]